MITVFTNGPVFIGNGQILDKGTIIVEDDRITNVASGDTSIPANARCIDLSGHMLFPGFIDCHVHLCLDGSADPEAAVNRQSLSMLTLRAARAAKKTLMAGVTTVRDMGGIQGIDLGIRDAVDSRLIPGPRVLASGQLVCITGGHGWKIGGREADGPYEVRKAVREQLKSGCDLVKMMATGGVLTPGSAPGVAQMSEQELRAGVEEAHRAGRLTAAHAQGAEGIENALRAGIDSIEHGIFLNEALISLFLEKNTALVPTLSAPANILQAGTESGIPEEIVKKTAMVGKTHMQSITMAREAQVTIGMGTDAGTPFNRHGDNLNEIKYMTEIGFSPEQAITAATETAAKILGLQDRLGVIKEGYLADLVIVKGDPLAQIDLLTDSENIRTVMQTGKVVKGDLQ